MNNGVVRGACIEGDCDEEDEEEEEEDALISGGSSGEGGCKTAAATICMGFYGDGGIHDRLVDHDTPKDLYLS